MRFWISFLFGRTVTMFVKMALKNLTLQRKNYVIPLFIQVCFSCILVFSSLIIYLPAFSSENPSSYTSNSLPAIILLTFFFLMLYVNRFLQRRRSLEWANELLTGLTKKQLARIFLYENLAVGLLGLILGAFLGAGILVLLFSLMGGDVLSAPILSVILQMGGCFLLTLFLSLACSLFSLRNKSIRELLSNSRQNEEKKVGIMQLFLSLFLFLLSICLLLFQLFTLSPLAVSTICFSVGLLLYSFYTLFYGFFSYCRKRRMKLFYQYRFLLLASEFLSRIKTISRMSVVISSCFLLSAVSFLTGSVFLTENMEPLFSQSKRMGLIQVTISIVFIVVFFSILALVQMVDVKEQRQKYQILFQLGQMPKEQNRLLFFQILLNYFLPVLMGLFVLFLSLFPLQSALSHLFSSENFLILGAVLYLALFGFLYLGYTLLTYYQIKKSVQASIREKDVLL